MDDRFTHTPLSYISPQAHDTPSTTSKIASTNPLKRKNDHDDDSDDEIQTVMAKRREKLYKPGPEFEARTRKIIYIAALLRHKLNGDVVPKILDEAGMWQKIEITASGCGWVNTVDCLLVSGIVLPAYIGQGTVRVVRFTFRGMLLQYSPLHTLNGTPLPNEESEVVASWFEVGMVGLEGEQRCRDDKYDPIPIPSPQPRYPSEFWQHEQSRQSHYKYGGKVLMRKETIEYDEEMELLQRSRDDTMLMGIVEWSTNDDDSDVRQMLKELRGGSGIEISCFAVYPMRIFDPSVVVEIEYAVVTKM